MPDDGYNYLFHLREIRNAGGGSSFYQNPKARLDQLPRDVKVCFMFYLDYSYSLFLIEHLTILFIVLDGLYLLD